MFGGGGPCSYTTRAKVRSMDALLAEKDRTCFVLGTTSLSLPNQVRVVEYDATASELRVRQTFHHDGQIMQLSPSPLDPQLLWTCSRQPQHRAVHAQLWRMEGGPTEAEEDDIAPGTLTPVTEIRAHEDLLQVVWNDGDDKEATSIATAHKNHVVRLWSLNDGGALPQESLSLSPNDTNTNSNTKDTIGALRWDPHHAHSMAIASGSAVHTWDPRCDAKSRSSLRIPEAHGAATPVLDIDYNPNKPHCLVSGGADGKMKFWDLRHVRQPLLSLAAHTHWVTHVRYNRFHDQLVASSSTDCSVALWRVSSISSSPIVELDEQDLMSDTAAARDVADAKVKSYDEHQDSVYALAWSANDSWVFAAVSYDGRLTLNVVPSTEKYKILL